MSQDYKLKFDQMRENHPGQAESSVNTQLYPNAGYNRLVAFVLPSGDCESFNYAYLVSLKNRTQDGMILAIFTTDTVTIKGYNLQNLYFELFDSRNRIVKCVDERYKALEETDESIVTEITIKKNS